MSKQLIVFIVLTKMPIINKYDKLKTPHKISYSELWINMLMSFSIYTILMSIFANKFKNYFVNAKNAYRRGREFPRQNAQFNNGL